MKTRSPARAQRLVERQTERPPSSRVRMERSLDRILMSIEERVEVPKDIEDRIVFNLIGRASGADAESRSTADLLSGVERRVHVPEELQDRVVSSVLRSSRMKRALFPALVVLFALGAGIAFLIANRP